MNAKNPIEDVVKPAVEGTMNVLSSLRKATSVKRYVHTSSIAAVMRMNEANGNVFDESDFNTYSSVANGDAYGYAKYESEMRVWQFMREESIRARQLDFVVLNPAFVFGECFTKAHTKASPVLLRHVIYGSKQVPFTTWAVDVDDVATAHVRALTMDSSTNKVSIGHFA